MSWYSGVVEWIQLHVWRLYKYFRHQSTGQCEIERIVREHTSTDESAMVVALNQSFYYSAQLSSLLAPIYGPHHFHRATAATAAIIALTIPTTGEGVSEESKKAVARILEIKKFNRNTHIPAVVTALSTAVSSALAINHLYHHLHTAAKVAYDEKNPNHEKQLSSLWSLLQPNKKLTARHSNDWGELGFQGTNPATDFRGAGVLGLNNLLQFARHNSEDCQRLLRQSQRHGLQWYSFAITGLNITHDLLTLTKNHELDKYYLRYGVSVQSFHALYSVIFVRFNEEWVRENPVNVMEFARIRKQFLAEVRRQAMYVHLDGFEYLQPLTTDVSVYSNTIDA